MERSVQQPDRRLEEFERDDVTMADLEAEQVTALPMRLETAPMGGHHRRSHGCERGSQGFESSGGRCLHRG